MTLNERLEQINTELAEAEHQMSCLIAEYDIINDIEHAREFENLSELIFSLSGELSSIISAIN